MLLTIRNIRLSLCNPAECRDTEAGEEQPTTNKRGQAGAQNSDRRIKNTNKYI